VQRQYRAIPRRNAGFRVCGAVPLADRLFRRDDRAAEQLPRRDQQSAAPGRGCRRVGEHDTGDITIQFTDYNASTGELLFNANSSQVIDIPAYIRSLQNCGVFSTVSYTGYKADDDGYSIDLRCVLAAPQQ